MAWYPAIRKTYDLVNVELRIVDLLESESVVQFANGLKRDIDRLDIVMLNAGISTEKYATSPDGWESS
jgi:NADP-dependent 3-hydroxy acid dehydrogenase YdfG